MGIFVLSRSSLFISLITVLTQICCRRRLLMVKRRFRIDATSRLSSGLGWVAGEAVLSPEQAGGIQPLEACCRNTNEQY